MIPISGSNSLLGFGEECDILKVDFLCHSDACDVPETRSATKVNRVRKLATCLSPGACWVTEQMDPDLRAHTQGTSLFLKGFDQNGGKVVNA